VGFSGFQTYWGPETKFSRILYCKKPFGINEHCPVFTQVISRDPNSTKSIFQTALNESIREGLHKESNGIDKAIREAFHAAMNDFIEKSLEKEMDKYIAEYIQRNRD
jgi:hypothetical protein